MLRLFIRSRGIPLFRRSFSGNAGTSQLQHGGKGESTPIPKDDPVDTPLSPLYTQRVGMFLEPGVLFKDHKRRRFLTFKLYLFSVVSLTVIFMMIKIVPPGYVGLVVRKDGTIDQFNNKGRLALFYIPFLETPVAFRTTPIRKKILQKFTTRDKQEIEVVIFLDLQAKLAYASQIYQVYGINYSKEFVEKELLFDVEQVVQKFNKADLLIQSDKIEHLFDQNGQRVASLQGHKATEEIVERFTDAGAFNRIVVSNVVGSSS